MKILFLGAICDEKFFENLIKSSIKIKPNIAGQKFEKNIVEGISNECKVDVISVLPIASYPSYPKLLIKKKKSIFPKDTEIKYVPFINISILKQMLISISTFFMVLNWLFNNKQKNKIILINVVYPPTAIPVLFLSKLFSCPISVVVPDASSFRFDYSHTEGFFRRKLISIFKRMCEKIDNKFDGYILLTEEMNKLVNSRNKPSIIIEGMVKDKFYNIKNDVSIKSKKKIIMYAGSLHQRYGIAKLIEAFEKIENDNIELWIFGDGDCKSKIVQIVSESHRIKFFGIVTHDEIIEYEVKADLLVNPRPTYEEFTKYSFPSKTIEYMASGTPLLTTKLQGIPNEYWQYVYTFIDETVEGMAKRMEEILSKTDNELIRFGEKAREYIIQNKNYLVQTKKIINFLDDIIYKK